MCRGFESLPRYHFKINGLARCYGKNAADRGRFCHKMRLSETRINPPLSESARLDLWRVCGKFACRPCGRVLVPPAGGVGGRHALPGNLAFAGWCHPLRRSGIMVTRELFGSEARPEEGLVRAEGLEPSQALRPNGFSYPATAFAASAAWRRGLGSGLSLHRVPDRSGFRCCPSSLYTFPAADCPAGLGSGSPFHRVPRL